jgi:hypothetical protein
MRHGRDILGRARGALLILAWSAALAGGCQSTKRPTLLPLRPTFGDAAGADLPMFRVRIVRLIHRVRPDAPMEDVWRLLGTTNLPHEKRALWEANDLRVGDGAQLAADRMNDLLTNTADRTASVNVILTREDLDFRIAMGGEREALDLLWPDEAGRLSGRHFDEARTELRCVCRSDAKDARAVRLAVVPEVLYGKEVLQWVRTESGYAQKLARRTFSLSDLGAEVRLEPGRLLVIGGRRSSSLSVGGAFFHETRGPDTYVQTLIITADRVLPGTGPAEAGPVPFVPPAGAAGGPGRGSP